MRCGFYISSFLFATFFYIFAKITIFWCVEPVRIWSCDMQCVTPAHDRYSDMSVCFNDNRSVRPFNLYSNHRCNLRESCMFPGMQPMSARSKLPHE
ncbi:hypothetical protein BJ742DRAFT_251201 [Cladochytrium replicatum]|nr:hypothetical protein BJ742DRAFT_251201 [Cladochytrium replicatum]